MMDKSPSISPFNISTPLEAVTSFICSYLHRRLPEYKLDVFAWRLANSLLLQLKCRGELSIDVNLKGRIAVAFTEAARCINVEIHQLCELLPVGVKIRLTTDTASYSICGKRDEVCLFSRDPLFIDSACSYKLPLKLEQFSEGQLNWTEYKLVSRALSRRSPAGAGDAQPAGEKQAVRKTKKAMRKRRSAQALSLPTPPPPKNASFFVTAAKSSIAPVSLLNGAAPLSIPRDYHIPRGKTAGNFMLPDQVLQSIGMLTVEVPRSQPRLQIPASAICDLDDFERMLRGLFVGRY